MPRAYVIVQMAITDAAAYAEYRQHTPASIAAYGGRFLVRGGTVETFEGEPPLPRIVVLEFPSLAQAQAWYHSPDYPKLAAIRQGASEGRMFVVEGAD